MPKGTAERSFQDFDKETSTEAVRGFPSPVNDSFAKRATFAHPCWRGEAKGGIIRSSEFKPRSVNERTKQEVPCHERVKPKLNSGRRPPTSPIIQGKRNPPSYGGEGGTPSSRGASSLERAGLQWLLVVNQREERCRKNGAHMARVDKRRRKDFFSDSKKASSRGGVYPCKGWKKETWACPWEPGC